MFTTYIKDSIPFTVNLLHDKEGRPDKYYAHVFTPVCEKKVCYSLVVDIYWDLLGNFDSYKHPIDSPLTKFDHEVFTLEDETKLKEILSDKSSLLRFYDSEDLTDNNERKMSNVIDGTTAATNKSIQNSVVPGAVHSSYTLWHIINGPAAAQILKHTESLFDDALISRMLKSNNYHYQYYALEKLPVNNNPEYLADIISLISKGKSYVPYFAIDKLPEEAWKSPENQLAIIKLFKEVDFKIQNQIINNLKGHSLSLNALGALIDNFKVLKENQIITSLDIVALNQGTLSHDLLLKLSGLLKSPNPEVSEKAFLILKDKSGELNDLEKAVEEYENRINKIEIMKNNGLN